MAEAVDHVEGIAGDPGHSIDLALDLADHRVVDGAETVEAGVIVGHGGADPGLGVAHLELKCGPAEVLELLEAPVEVVDGVRNLLGAVMERGRAGVRGKVVVEEAGDVAGVVEAHREGGLSEVLRGDGGAVVGGEGAKAEMGVPGVDA